MSLTTYEQARPWAKAIQEEALERRMPPWGAVKGFGDFLDEAGLTQEEIHLLSDWVDGGAPEGDPQFLPELPRFERGTPAAAGQRVKTLRGGLALKEALTLTAITPRGLAKGTGVRVIARRPDTSIEPLLWIYDFNPKFARTYVYRAPVELPAGTRVEMLPPVSGSILLSGKSR